MTFCINNMNIQSQKLQGDKQNDTTYMFEVQQNLPAQLYPFFVDVFDGHQVALRVSTEAVVNPP